MSEQCNGPYCEACGDCVVCHAEDRCSGSEDGEHCSMTPLPRSLQEFVETACRAQKAYRDSRSEEEKAARRGEWASPEVVSVLLDEDATIFGQAFCETKEVAGVTLYRRIEPGKWMAWERKE